MALAAFGTRDVRWAEDAEVAYRLLAQLSSPGAIGWTQPPHLRPWGPWMGGMAFDVSRSPGPLWAGFPLAKWWLPEVVVWRRGEETFLTGFAPATLTARELELDLSRAAASLAEAQLPRPAPRRLSIRGDRAAWERLLGASLKEIAEGRLSKVVVARAIDIESETPFSPFEAAHRLSRDVPACTTFLFREERSFFLGATPETLCRVVGRDLGTEALAGTPRTATVERADKESREHEEVVRAIVEGLSPLCEWVEKAPAPESLSLPRVSHLRTPIRARLRGDAGLAEVVRALHPTPAVGGTPRPAALSFLESHENLDRGWYAGLVGLIGEAGAELKVALRCALLRGHSARAFVGAGIVRGSVPESEWRETEAKAGMLLGALSGEAAEEKAHGEPPDEALRILEHCQ
jgi:salicylate biosynthesis isochorismate synthase/menaquinone-specific isochorismate synthase